MGSLFAGLHIASNALDAFQRAISVTSTNVTNASTPGYASQQVVLSADSFDSTTTVGGGVSYGGTVDSRDEYAERSVRQSVSQQGEATQRATDYTRLQQIVPVDGTSGISTALDSFFSAFSSLTTAPNDTTARQLALDQATQVAQSFHQAAEALDQAKQGTQQDLTEQVDQVNTIAARIASINKQYEQNADATTDPGLNAQMSQSLQELAQYADVTVLKQDNGTVMVNVGQSLLVSGDRSMPLQWASGAGQRVLEDSQGNDLSTSLRSGSLSELLNQADSVEPGMESNLNQLAQSFATAVNGTLQTGVDESNNAPTQDLFSFDAVAGAAATIAVNSLQPADLALADPTAPGGNAVAVKVANLQQTALVGGATLTQFYGNVAAQVGQSLSNAENDQTTAESLTSQAETLRSDIQGVSLDKEAMNLLEYQRSYDATSQFVKVINQLTQDVIGLLS
jgi:flagellar hook-associated protein 1 FlgK